MTRQPREKKTEADVTKPLNMELEDAGNCYGKAYNPQCKECTACHDSVTCAIYYQKYLKDIIRQRETEEGGFLDMQDFTAVPIETFVGALRKSGETPVANALKVVAHYAKSKDDVACMRFLVDFAGKNGFTIKDGKVCPT